MKDLEAAENRKDIEGILDLVVDDFVFVSADIVLEGKADIRAMLIEAAKNYISSMHIPVRIEVSSSGDLAWLLGYELNKRQRREGIIDTKQYYMITFKKVDKSWKQVAVCIA